MVTAAQSQSEPLEIAPELLTPEPLVWSGELAPAPTNPEATPADTDTRRDLLDDFFEGPFLDESLNLTKGAANNYRIAIRHLNRFAGRRVACSELSESLVRDFMRNRKENDGSSERTINNQRSAIMTVWRAAATAGLCSNPGKITRLKEPKRVVQAWTVEEVGRIIEAAPWTPRTNGWSAQHWIALVLVIYDTSHRIGALLQTPRSAVNSDGFLLVRAEVSKHKADTVRRLHPDTHAVVKSLPETQLLFQWPLAKRELWRRFKLILIAARLPCTQRDLFHKLRRTSFTYTYALLGAQAARDHAAHSTDMTANYLDRELLGALQKSQSPVDVLPRPAFGK